MAFIRDAINSCDASNDMEAVVKEQLETLMTLAEKNADLAEAEITASLKDGKINDDLYVPITKVISKSKEIRVVTSEKNTDIVGKISKSIGKFFNPGKEEILSGVSEIVSDTLDTLMGSGEGMEARRNLYVVAVEYPSVIRLDFSMWVRNTRAKGLREKCKNAVCVVAFKSAVDIAHLDFATFVSVYSSVLSKSFGSDVKNVDELLNAAENIYKRLGLQTASKARQALPPIRQPLCSKLVKTPATVGDF